MPFGGPVVALRQIDVDPGDDRGAELQALLETRLLSFEFSDHATRLDQLKLTLRNDDFALLDHPVFTPGQKLEVTWGWPGRMAAPRRMVVKGIKAAQNTLVVWGHCTLCLLHKSPRARFMAGVTDAEFVRAVAEEYGYVGSLAHVEPTTVRHDITQPRAWTDAQQLHVLARNNGFTLYIDETGLHWHRRPTDRGPVRDFVYRVDPGQGTILEPPQFEMNLARPVTRVRVVSLDPVRKQIVEQTAGIDDEGHVSLGREDDLFAPDDPDAGLRGSRIGAEAVLAGGLLTPAEALARAEGQYRDTVSGRYKCTLRIVGDAQLTAKCLVGLWGEVAQAMAGLYYVNEARSEIGPGRFTMELKMTKDARFEVAASRKRAPRKRTNAQSGPVMDFTQPEMQILLTATVDEYGQIVPAYIWTDDGGKTGQTSPVTDEDWQGNYTEEQREQWRYSQGAVSLPDR